MFKAEIDITKLNCKIIKLKFHINKHISENDTCNLLLILSINNKAFEHIVTIIKIEHSIEQNSMTN